MDAKRFDQIARSLNGSSRRAILSLVLGGGALSLLGSRDGEGKKKKGKHKKKKKKTCKSGTKRCGNVCAVCCSNADCATGETCFNGDCCAPDCLGKECGPDGCGGSCGVCEDADRTCENGACECISGHEECAEICCGECQTCIAGNACVMAPDSDEDPCSNGACCGGACCPASCWCGVPGLSGALAEFIADYLGLPYPACVAPGTGNQCGALGGTCQTGTDCVIVGAGVGVCIGVCPGVDYPDAV